MLRRSPRAFGLWAGAAVLALVTGAVVARDLATLHRRARTFGPVRPVVVARNDLPMGATVTPADVTTRGVHASQHPRGVLHDREAAIGRVVQVPVVRDAFVSERNLAPRARDGLAGALPEGTRAVRIVVDDGLRPPPGSAVDVYAVFASGDDVLGSGRSASGPARLVAAGVMVLATDGGPSTTFGAGRVGTGSAVAGSSLPAGGRVGVTLLVDAEQAADLAAAAARGSLYLALVPPEDARPVGPVTRR
jgi:Flp pilus assembly protein CpaB